MNYGEKHLKHQLFDRSIIIHCQCQNNTNSQWLNKSLSIVYPTLLLKSFCNQSCFKTIHRTIRFLLNFVNPLVSYHIVIIGQGTKCSSPITYQSIKLQFHCISPSGIKGSLAIAIGFSLMKNGMKKMERMFGGGE